MNIHENVSLGPGSDPGMVCGVEVEWSGNKNTKATAMRLRAEAM